MKKNKMLPMLACTGITKNKELYLPYLGAGIFAAFLYFTFGSILYHPVMRTLPKAAYAAAMMILGFILLTIIVLPFLFYTYRFVIKRRKKELGLYSILGLEKKHIAVMMIYENIITTLIIIFGGVLLGMVFSKLVFWLLCYMMKLPVLNQFPFSFQAFGNTVLFFSVSAAFNLAFSLYSVGKSNPIELFSDGRKGEKKLKHIWLYALAGTAALAAGYGLSITSKLDWRIFNKFFFAVLLVVIGTYLLFTSGSVLALGVLRKKKSFYYKPSNFITISGMYYRMKQSAAGLVNICIFSTMIIITLSCTVSVYLEMENIVRFENPYDIGLIQYTDQIEKDRQEVFSAVRALEADSKAEVTALVSYSSRNMRAYIKDGRLDDPEDRNMWHPDVYEVEFLTLEEYNQAAGENRTLKEREIFIYSKGQSFAKEKIIIFGEPYTIKEELLQFPGSIKLEENSRQIAYWIVAESFEALPEALLQQLSVDTLRSFLYVAGAEEECAAFAEKLEEQVPCDYFRNKIEAKTDTRSMFGGLLFIGIFFGGLFMICLIVIMYYKQITEGYEDRNNFEIMQKVGMSHDEIKHTIAKQILLVFFLPIFGAVCHTMAAVSMTANLLSAINLYNRQIVVVSCAGVLVVFLVIYGISYLATAKAYLRIVERRGS